MTLDGWPEAYLDLTRPNTKGQIVVPHGINEAILTA